MKIMSSILILSLLLLLAGCDEEEAQNINATFVKEYNAKLAEANQLVKEHNQLIFEVNANINNTDVNRQKMTIYLDWVEKNKSVLIDFQSYVEMNNGQIQNHGLNPDDVREDVVETLDIIGQNEVSFRSFLD